MKQLKKFYQQIPSWLKNRYLLSSVFFIVWMLFFDTNTIWSQIKLQMTINKMEAKKSYYEAEIDRVNQDLDDLLTDDRTLEKFARENYFMKKENEDIFVITED